MSKYRTSSYDVAPRIKKPADKKPGELGPNRIPIFDSKGRRRGHVGYKSSEATVAGKFGVANPKLGKMDGRTAWLGTGNVTGGFGSAQNAKIKKSLRAAKGSNK